MARDPLVQKYGTVTTSADGPATSPPTLNNNVVDEADFVTRNEDQDLKRGLSQRHISLIAIAGAIVSFPSLPQLKEPY